MNQRARDLLKRQAAQLDQISGTLHMLLDNPDDAGLSHEAEAELRNAIGMVEATREEMAKLVHK